MSTAPLPTSRIRAADRRPGAIAAVAFPVTIVLGLLAVVIGLLIASYHGNLTGFVFFGSQFVHATHPPAGALSGGPTGYDGQFFYVLAHDPLLLHHGVLAQMRATGELFRIQRLGYPLLAFILAGGRSTAIPGAMLAVNVLVLVLVTSGSALWLHRRGRTPLWAVAVALAPGMLMPSLRDLSDPMSTACVLAGVLLWQSRRCWPAAAALAYAALTREVMILVVVALAVEAAARAWRSRGTPGAWRTIAGEVWPVLVVPTVIFGAWQLYVTVRAGGPLGTSQGLPPFIGMMIETRSMFHVYGLPLGLVNLVYILLTLAAIGCAWLSARDHLSSLNVAALALSLCVILTRLDDFWGATRLGAPVLAVMLFDGLQRRDRRTIAVCCSASALSVLFLIGI